MRILFMTNFFPPYDTGGEGQSCLQIVQGLKQRGHSTFVLTSMHGLDNKPLIGDGLSRSLYFEMDLIPWRNSLNFFIERKRREKHNHQRFWSVLEQFRPDIVFICGMWNLHRSLAFLAENGCPGKVIYRFATYWPILPSQYELYWKSPALTLKNRYPKILLSRIALRLLSKENHNPALKFEHAICVSEATRQELIKAKIPVSHARVIHTGIDVKPYINDKSFRSYRQDGELKILYAGRLAQEKGIETIITAMTKLIHERGKQNIILNLAGTALNSGYEIYLKALVNQEEMTNFISFLGYIPHEDIPELMQQHDILVVPSTWQEPFSRSVLEGMLSGMAVIATPTGGTSEIISNGENGLFVTPGDAQDLSVKINDLEANPFLFHKLANNGRETVLNRFNLDRMIDEIENFLLDVAE
jgi:glycogen synthase